MERTVKTLKTKKLLIHCLVARTVEVVLGNLQKTKAASIAKENARAILLFIALNSQKLPTPSLKSLLINAISRARGADV